MYSLFDWQFSIPPFSITPDSNILYISDEEEEDHAWNHCETKLHKDRDFALESAYEIEQYLSFAKPHWRSILLLEQMFYGIKYEQYCFDIKIISQELTKRHIGITDHRIFETVTILYNNVESISGCTLIDKPERSWSKEKLAFSLDQLIYALDLVLDKMTQPMGGTKSTVKRLSFILTLLDKNLIVA